MYVAVFPSFSKQSTTTRESRETDTRAILLRSSVFAQWCCRMYIVHVVPCCERDSTASSGSSTSSLQHLYSSRHQFWSWNVFLWSRISYIFKWLTVSTTTGVISLNHSFIHKHDWIEQFVYPPVNRARETWFFFQYVECDTSLARFLKDTALLYVLVLSYLFVMVIVVIRPGNFHTSGC